MEQASLENTKESQERGKNVKITIKFMRHGERTKEGELIDQGRDKTRELARESGLQGEDFDAVKAYGSTAGPTSLVENDGREMARSLETAHIYAKTIAGDDAFVTRGRSPLSYYSLKSKPPYDHEAIYNANLPDGFEELEGEERAQAAKKAQDAVMDHLTNLDTPEAQQYKREIAGSFAYFIRHKIKMAKKIDSGKNILMPTGSHGGLMEFLLQHALVREDEKGNKVEGFKDISEIGGGFDPSEAFDVRIQTDENGEIGQLDVSFDNPERPESPTMYLDRSKIEELADFYENLHKDDVE